MVSLGSKAVIPTLTLRQVRDQKQPSRLAREHWQTCADLFLALGCAELANPVDGLSSDVANVWQGDDFTVAVDTVGRDRRITCAGVTYLVAVKSVDDTNGVITFVDTRDPNMLLSFMKHPGDGRDEGKCSLAFRFDEVPVGNMTYLRPARRRPVVRRRASPASGRPCDRRRRKVTSLTGAAPTGPCRGAAG